MGRLRNPVFICIALCVCYLLFARISGGSDRKTPASMLVADQGDGITTKIGNANRVAPAGGHDRSRDAGALEIDNLPFKPRERSAAEAAWGDVEHPEAVHSTVIRSRSFDKLGPDIGPKRMHGRLGETFPLPSPSPYTYVPL